MSAELPADPVFLIAAGLLAAGALSAAFTDKVRIPGLLIFLALGMLFGDDGLNLISLSDPRVAQTFGVLALLVILFQGGLTTKPSDLRLAALPGLGLATFGVVLTAAVVAAGAMLLAGVDLITAALIGAVVSSTDAVAVFGLLRKAPLPRRITALLEVESGANDPMAILLTVAVLEAWSSTLSAGDWLLFGLAQLGGGLLIGALVGWAGSWLLRRVHLGAAGLYPVLALGVAGLSYGTGAALGASGFLAVYITGLIVGAQVPRHRRGIREFHDVLANTAEIGLFLMLGLLVFPSRLPPVILTGVTVTAVLVFIARPLAVFSVLGVPL
ncbi:MAG: sodium:proton exchanger, partial [Nitriliruptorales bacterium]|nr:sodium:proton exchanger [Nitriliruptorales bacterium]